MSADFIKKPCQHCPFRNDVAPFLHPERGEELAYASANPYNVFPCHKTTVQSDDEESTDRLIVETSKECAGFLTLRAAEIGEEFMPEGFKPSYEIVYTDVHEMAMAYKDA
ncbi:MAG: hypothetical protein JKX92_05860 [Porticoccaceae bacterium]|nr:hypothetical protein [Porticoccaceae bacterium]